MPVHTLCLPHVISPPHLSLLGSSDDENALSVQKTGSGSPGILGPCDKLACVPQVPEHTWAVKLWSTMVRGLAAN
jgi:hypothetical protein